MFANLNFYNNAKLFSSKYSDVLKLVVFYTLPVCIERVFYLVLNLNHVVKIWILKFKETFK